MRRLLITALLGMGLVVSGAASGVSESAEVRLRSTSEIEGASVRLAEVARMEDERAHERLTRLRGVGRWTADIYLLMALGRPDIWPRGDLALAKAAQRVKELPRLPTDEQLEEIASAWRPWRAVAARMLWHEYLSRI